MEECTKCKRPYFRDFIVRNPKNKAKEHKTGRKCDDPRCRGYLKDTIINFGENLRERNLSGGWKASSHADLMVSMGSSLRVSPANNMVEMAGRYGNVCIVNLQKTHIT